MSLDALGLSLSGRLSPTDFSVAPGQSVALIGPNGSGKTSLLRVLAGIAGKARSLRVSGEDLKSATPARRARMVGFLPALRSVQWAIPVRDLLELSPLSADKDRIRELVERLQLTPFLDRPANALSTGERARVLIARTLATRPRHLLLDEPLANLDPYWVLTLRDLFAEEAASGRGLVVAMHDLSQMQAFDRLVLMRDQQIVADAPRFELEHSDTIARLFDLTRDADGKMRL
ncbi:ABC transporter ATP-binding protein [Sphingomicrobium sp. XHP0235]|uniref:ABC transporter ATP-binding protein n=1 Tax=Sphingomicrobium aquimarinum TaxID=3133971 RepID=UPI0031FF2B73